MTPHEKAVIEAAIEYERTMRAAKRVWDSDDSKDWTKRMNNVHGAYADAQVALFKSVRALKRAQKG